jgi:glucokinase
MARRGPVAAIDIGGTKIAVAVVEPGGRLIAAARTGTPRELDSEQLWWTLQSLTSQVLEGAGLATTELSGIGCGCGGPMEWPAGKVSPLNIPAWRSFPLRDRLAGHFAGLPVRLHNDAVCMAVGEHWRGAGRGRRDMLGMVISTGIGGGLVLDGRLVTGATGNCGHIGHVIVDPADGPPCACGGKGCLEAIVRGPALAAWAQQQGWRPGQRGMTARELADDAARGHPIGVAAMRRAGRAIGIAIASATHLCDLEVVVIGGGLAQAGALLFSQIDETVRMYARLDFARDVRVVPTGLGQDSGLVGAAALHFAGDRYWAGD